MLNLKNYMQKFIIFVLILLLTPLMVFGRIGVGVGTGKIVVDEPLKPGGVYTLPSLSVLNTGDEAGEYGASIEYHQDQPQIQPAREWFSFNPSSFHLEPGESQSVAVSLTLPVKTRPGDYFAYLEGHPIKTAKPGTSISVAAAAKLYFTVAPANFIQGIYYRVISFFAAYSPWPYIALAVIIAAIIIILIKKNFSFNLNIKKKE